MAKKKYYAYSINGENGIVDSWDECQSIVSGKKAKYKSFESKDQAERWLQMGADYSLKNTASVDGVYFDAGTGLGMGVEVSVTDKNGKTLLKENVNERGNFLIKESVTNNFGELLACKFALEIALDKNCKKIFGDSKLILEYWSRGYIKKEIPEETRKLAQQVKQLRYEFEKNGGVMSHISGGSNPADLGFHRN
ncbi:MAG: ribonuclease H family protein [Candidatus Pacebacteria bacterium]|jgi:ribonuclease HI|nr:ribonuclease H family protein [Candidatus Paceibacterota bacterium]MDD3969915.1 ribonuclease H family protein [Candidatus Paceibacterota bacterium]MDD4737917.1 ribonuclease H family protein [Candidatus Paceibacterota bacterium]